SHEQQVVVLLPRLRREKQLSAQAIDAGRIAPARIGSDGLAEPLGEIRVPAGPVKDALQQRLRVPLAEGFGFCNHPFFAGKSESAKGQRNQMLMLPPRRPPHSSRLSPFALSLEGFPLAGHSLLREAPRSAPGLPPAGRLPPA